ncbi:MAG TPA: tetratricopeptide repeat protein [Polyangiaceae bacterium]|nr:tetratricopeptide repeat protein [Polyangiaceae bacterium]
MNKRLAFLEQLVEGGKADSFARYALALEYKKEGRTDDALRVFEGLRSSDPAYVPQYLMAGSLLSGAGRTDEARSWLEAGISAARSSGDSHALGELESALGAL